MALYLKEMERNQNKSDIPQVYRKIFNSFMSDLLT